MSVSLGRSFPTKRDGMGKYVQSWFTEYCGGAYIVASVRDKHETALLSPGTRIMKEHGSRLVGSMIAQWRDRRSLNVLDYTAMVLWQCVWKQVEREGPVGCACVSDSVVRKAVHKRAGRAAVVAVVGRANLLLATRVCIDIWCAAVQESLSGAAILARVVAVESVVALYAPVVG